MSDPVAAAAFDPRVLASASDLSGDIDFQQVMLPGDFSEAASLRARWVVPVRQPMVLISQVQRSGGHLLVRLLDGHPNCFSHPHELQWGRPRKCDWPSFGTPDLTPDSALALLSERWHANAVAEGGMRAGGAAAGALYPYMFDTALRDALVKALVASWTVASRRDVLDAYLTASFNAWLDYRGLYAAPKKYVIAFIPGVTTVPDSLERFFTDYPDGRLVTLVRHPGSWLASALSSPSLAREHGGDTDAALRLWTRSTEASLRAADTFGDRVTVRFFDDLVHRTQETMTDLCARLGLDVHPCLTTPTFNGMPILSNSLHAPVVGLDAGATDRHNSILLPEQRARVAATTLPLYEDLVSRHGPGRP